MLVTETNDNETLGDINSWVSNPEGRLRLETDQWGILGKAAVLEALVEVGYDCDCQGQHASNWHHDKFDARAVEIFVDGHEDDQERELLRFAYSSIFGGFRLPVCAHDAIQDTTMPTPFASLEVLLQLHNEHKILQIYTDGLKSARAAYNELATSRGATEVLTPKERMRRAKGLPIEDRLAAYKRAKLTRAEIKKQNEGRAYQRDALLEAFGDDSILLTPDRLTSARAYHKILRVLTAERTITHAEIRQKLDERQQFWAFDLRSLLQA